MADKVAELLLGALKQALAEPNEQRLYKSGKLTGLFPSRAGASGDAAARAVREGLLEVVRTEVRGKTLFEWVRPGPPGVAYVRQRESPLRVLEDLRYALRTAQDGVPAWLNEMRRDLQAVSAKLVEDAQRWQHRLDSLGQRVEETLRRLEDERLYLSDGVAAVPWVKEAMTYLDHRREGGANGPCPLPELFAALAAGQPDFSVTAFHDGLRRLHRRNAVRLLPFAGGTGELPEPEYALLDGADVLYYVARSSG